MIASERVRKAFVIASLLMITSASQAVLAQSAGHSSMKIDFGHLKIDGSCDTSSSFFYYDGSESNNRCLLVEFDAQANSRLNLSIQSERTGDVLETIELFASHRTQPIVTIALSLEIPLDMMTITIAAITIGIAVDNSIHYIYRFKEEYKKINDYNKTLEKCHNTVGVAILNTSITIVFGFSILVLSNFIPTIYFGIFTGIAMLLAMISVLTLLPKLILTFKPFKNG